MNEEYKVSEIQIKENTVRIAFAGGATWQFSKAPEFKVVLGGEVFDGQDQMGNNT